MLKSACQWICFRTSFSWVRINPSLQIHLFCENWRKCFQTWNLTYGLFSSVLIRHDLHVADSLPWNKACKHSLSLSSLLVSMPCWECKYILVHTILSFLIQPEWLTCRGCFQMLLDHEYNFKLVFYQWTHWTVEVTWESLTKAVTSGTFFLWNIINV